MLISVSRARNEQSPLAQRSINCCCCCCCCYCYVLPAQVASKISRKPLLEGPSLGGQTRSGSPTIHRCCKLADGHCVQDCSAVPSCQVSGSWPMSHEGPSHISVSGQASGHRGTCDPKLSPQKQTNAKTTRLPARDFQARQSGQPRRQSRELPYQLRVWPGMSMQRRNVGPASLGESCRRSFFCDHPDIRSIKRQIGSRACCEPWT